MRTFKGIFFSLLLNLLAIQVLACVYPIPLEERVENADQIALGTIINQASFWDSSYVFLLEDIPNDKQVVLNAPNNFANPIYRPYAYVQGSLEQINGFYKDYFGAKPISKTTIIEYIKDKTGFVPTKPDGRHLFTGLSNPTPYIIPPRSQRRRTITFKDGLGNAATTFYAGCSEVEHELIIEGSGFGNGGLVEVYDSANNLVGSQEIVIDWSIKPIFSDYRSYEKNTRQFINFIDRNELGGYNISYNSTSGMSSNSAAKAAFERATAKWLCATGVHWTIDEQSTPEEVNADDLSVIMFLQDMPVGVVAMTASRYKASGNTRCSFENTTWYLREFDMQFAHPDNMLEGLSWNYSDNPPAFNEFDFETIALHELGHAHGLGHINSPNSTMYFSIENGANKRTIV